MTERALWIAKTGLDAQQTKMSIIANNLANVNTTGFKKSRPVFEDLFYQNIRQVGAQATQFSELPTGLQLGSGVRTVATEKLHTQGNVIQTNNSLDMAINGRGFFQILMPDGEINYTRDGSFALNSDGQIVTSGGLELQPGINVPTDAISLTVARDGTVTVLQPGDVTPSEIGRIELADFINPTGLEPIGENLFRESVSSGPPIIGTPDE
ncbi:MAG: flagellar basal-body rod protein FlgG, partial [Gammaproteobacteria bacterium]